MKKIFRLFISALIAINFLSVPVFAANEEDVYVKEEDVYVKTETDGPSIEIEPRWYEYTTHEGYAIYTFSNSTGFVLSGTVKISYNHSSSSGLIVKVYSCSATVSDDIGTDGETARIVSSSVYSSPSVGSTISISDFPRYITVFAKVKFNGQTSTYSAPVWCE